MNTLIHADIFFFVTTVIVVILALFAVIILYYVIRTAKAITSISETVKKESENLAEDMAEIREKIRDEGMKMYAFKGLMKKIFLGASFFKKASDYRRSKASKASSKKSAEREDDGEDEE